MQDANAVEAALKDAKFCVVARRAGNAGATAFYMSCKTGATFNFLLDLICLLWTCIWWNSLSEPSVLGIAAVGQMILCELQLLPTAARVTVKAATPGLSGIIVPAIQALLQNSLGAHSSPSASLPSGGLAGGINPAGALTMPAVSAAQQSPDPLEGLF